ncbi:MAG: EutN/CcmL family microcompartment protein [Candidatus Muiribacteriota bacterium]|jgi:microcompartment protein CcmK/EutM
MILGKVIGTVVSTKKDERLIGFKLLVVQKHDINLKPVSDYVVAVDTVGAGFNEVVLLVSGSSARQTARTDKKPVDAAVVGIVDSVSFKGE